ncbi:hypothetical protein CSKR_111802 [Clonorchis sinensis]|uniref:Uncharacterized protein n=1 Tax=Clonorchis sinensis TaxID=79923 RepID=A0A3R7JP40_CLOSI|nr:hypothetical protein CSKR_111802 [Clonorchis sinensis]
MPGLQITARHKLKRINGIPEKTDRSSSVTLCIALPSQLMQLPRGMFTDRRSQSMPFHFVNLMSKDCMTLVNISSNDCPSYKPSKMRRMSSLYSRSMKFSLGKIRTAMLTRRTTPSQYAVRHSFVPKPDSLVNLELYSSSHHLQPNCVKPTMRDRLTGFRPRILQHSVSVRSRRCSNAMLPGGSMRAERLSGCPSLARGSRDADVGFEPRTLQSESLRFNR